MNKSVRLSVFIAGAYACIIGFLHGVFEVMQGNVSTNGILIYAISKVSQKNEMWHGNFPAMTIFPNFLITGIFVIFISMTIIFYLFIKNKTGYNIFILIIL